MNKQIIRLTESDLHELIKDAVNEALNEIGDTNRGQYMMGRLAARQRTNGMKNHQTDKETGAEQTFNKAYQQQCMSGRMNQRQNAFYNGFHVGKDNAKSGYEMYKNQDMMD